MEEFYKKIKNKVENPPHEKTDWSVWDRVEKQLDDTKNRTIIPFWFWLVGAGTFGMIGYVLGKNQQSIKNANGDVELVRDTIYLEKTITHRDTIFKYLSRENNQELISLENLNSQLNTALAHYKLENASALQKLNAYGELIAKRGLLEDIEFAALPSIDNFRRFSITEVKEIKIGTAADIRSLLETMKLLNSTSELEELNFERQLPMITLSLTPSQMMKMKQSESLIEQLIPDYFNLGFMLEGPAITLDQNSNFGRRIGWSITPEVLFSSKFSITSGVSIISYTTTINDPLTALNYPQPSATGENEVFDHLAIKSSSLEIPISLKYKLNANRLVQPFLIAGASWVNFRNQEFIYEYKSEFEETYYEVKEPIDLPSGWNIHAEFGVSKSISTSFDLVSEVRFNYQLGGALLNRDYYSDIGLRLGVFWKI